MKRFILSGMLFSSFFSQAETVYVHHWEAGSSANKRTAIELTNVCKNTNVEATITFWNKDGTLLTNKNIDGIHTTDSNGQVNVTVAPKVRKTVSTYYQNFTGTGHAEITTKVSDASESTENLKCLIGNYYLWLTKTNNPYDGAGIAHLINKGDVF